MPDRAVVDDEQQWPILLTTEQLDAVQDALVQARDRAAYPNWRQTLETTNKNIAKQQLHHHEPQPRALVAISEDRQWLVVLAPPSRAESEPSFGVFRFRESDWLWEPRRTIPDTGQDAHEVLADFLRDRDQ